MTEIYAFRTENGAQNRRNDPELSQKVTYCAFAPFQRKGTDVRPKLTDFALRKEAEWGHLGPHSHSALPSQQLEVGGQGDKTAPPSQGRGGGTPCCPHLASGCKLMEPQLRLPGAAEGAYVA